MMRSPLLGALSLAFFLCAPARAPAQDLHLAGDQIKAGLIYSFLRYTDWSAAAPADARLTVCVYGHDAFNGGLNAMAGRSVNNHAITLRVVAVGEAITGCSLLYISAEQQSATWQRLRALLAGQHVLTVSDGRGFANSGGMIEFVEANERIGIRVNGAAIAGAGLAVQDRLMRLAESSGGGQ